jgi:hypothetical protein
MDEQLTELDAIYDLPWHRIGPYLVGVITAYIFVVRLQRKLVLKEVSTRTTLRNVHCNFFAENATHFVDSFPPVKLMDFVHSVH